MPKTPNYEKLVKEMAKLVDKGKKSHAAWEKVLKKHHLNDEEDSATALALWDAYEEYTEHHHDESE